MRERFVACLFRDKLPDKKNSEKSRVQEVNLVRRRGRMVLRSNSSGLVESLPEICQVVVWLGRSLHYRIELAVVLVVALW